MAKEITCFCNDLKQIELPNTKEEAKLFRTILNDLTVNRKLVRVYSFDYEFDFDDELDEGDEINYDERRFKCAECGQVWGLEIPTHFNSYTGGWKIIEEGKPLGTAAYVNYITTSVQKRYDTVVEAQIIITVVNTGDAPLLLSHSSYDIEDKDGKIIASSSRVKAFPQIISSGENGYYFDIIRIDGWSDVASFKVLPRLNVSPTYLDSIRIDVSEFYLNNPFPHVSTTSVLGRVENNTKEMQSNIRVAAIMFDKNEQPIGAIYLPIEGNIPAGAKIGFSGYIQSILKPSRDDIFKFEVYAYPIIYRHNALIT